MADAARPHNYLCEGYAKYFATATPTLKRIGALLQAGHDPREIMPRPLAAS